MALDLSRLTSATNTANALSDLIMAIPQEEIGIQPQPKDSLTGERLNSQKKFLFDYRGEEQLNLKSDVTDHYAEDNSAIQDQVALNPETITTQGFIGELNNVPPKELQAVKLAAEKMTPLVAYEPELTLTALRAYNTAFQGYQTAKTLENAAVQAWDTITQQEGRVRTKQGLAFQKFYGYWKKRTLFTVQTPWAVFDNMVIESLRVLQVDDYDDYSNFQITFKAMRFAETEVTFGEGEFLYDNLFFQNRTFNQGSPEVDKGVQKPVESDSLSSRIGSVA